MDRRHLIWPIIGTGAELADELDTAGYLATNASTGNAPDIVDGYLRWGSDQTRTLRNRLSPEDLGRLVTTPRYWSTVATPEPTRATAVAVLDELTSCARSLHEAASAVRAASEHWVSADSGYASLVLVDTNFWIEPSQGHAKIDWHDLIARSTGPGHVVDDSELRIVVPILIIDELDGLTHKAQIRPKAIGATKYLHGLLSGNTSGPVTITPEQSGRGAVTIQLVFDPYGHERHPINDDEIIERTIALRDFIGVSQKQAFFLTYDTGAAFRAEHAGLMPRLLATQPKI